jgi:hypothetical protein
MGEHPHIAKKKGFYIWKEASPMEKFVIVIVMELGEKSLQQDLDSKYQKRERYSENLILTWLY